MKVAAGMGERRVLDPVRRRKVGFPFEAPRNPRHRSEAIERPVGLSARGTTVQ
jgi:hypothetical protein